MSWCPGGSLWGLLVPHLSSSGCFFGAGPLPTSFPAHVISSGLIPPSTPGKGCDSGLTNQSV